MSYGMDDKITLSIMIVKHLSFHLRSKHINVQYISGYMIYWNPSNCNLRKFILMITTNIDDQVLTNGQVKIENKKYVEFPSLVQNKN